MLPRTSVTDPPAPEELGNLKEARKKEKEEKLSMAGVKNVTKKQSNAMMSLPRLHDALHTGTSTPSRGTASDSNVRQPQLCPFTLTHVWVFAVLLQHLVLVGYKGPKQQLPLPKSSSRHQPHPQRRRPGTLPAPASCVWQDQTP